MPRTKNSERQRIQTTKQIYGDQIFRDYGSIGGKSKTLKGMAWVKVHQPQRFNEIIKNRKRNAKS